jgi:glycosyltransferase involved in cell wall biosynthesis
MPTRSEAARDSGPPVSIVLLAYNEAATIEQELVSFHDAIVSRLPGSEILVAEDGSTDGTSQIVDRLATRLPLVHLSSPERLGYARALTRAVLAARNEWVFFSDTGCKHAPADFWKLYARIGDCDLVVGRKTRRRDQLYRRALSRAYNTTLRVYFDLDGVFDADSGFRLFNRQVVDRVFRPGLRFASFVGSEIVVRAILLGLRYAEVPVSYAQRAGESKGVPPRTIARQVRRVLGDLRALKRELRVTASGT